MSNRDKDGRPFLCRSGISSDFMPLIGGQREIGIKKKKMCSMKKNGIKSSWHKMNGIKSGPLLYYALMPNNPPGYPSVSVNTRSRTVRKKTVSATEPLLVATLRGCTTATTCCRYGNKIFVTEPKLVLGTCPPFPFREKGARRDENTGN